MAIQGAMASGSHVLVEVPGAPPAVVPVQVFNDLESSDTPQMERDTRQEIQASPKKALLVLILCAPVFIFTSGSSALLGRPRCGLSI